MRWVPSLSSAFRFLTSANLPHVDVTRRKNANVCKIFWFTSICAGLVYESEMLKYLESSDHRFPLGFHNLITCQSPNWTPNQDGRKTNFSNQRKSVNVKKTDVNLLKKNWIKNNFNSWRMKARYKWMANIKEGVVWCCPPVSLSWGPPKQPQFPLTDVKVAKFTFLISYWRISWLSSSFLKSNMKCHSCCMPDESTLCSKL